MTILPVIQRELRVALRGKEARKSRFLYAATSAGIAALCLVLHTFWNPVAFATKLHIWLFLLGLYVAVAGPLQLTSGLFAQDRQNNTFGLLFLAGISPAELFGGKVLSAFLVTSMNLLALAPALAIPFLTGGVSFSLFISTLFCLPVVLVFTLATVCLASALWNEESTARVGAAVGGVVLCAAPLLIYGMSSRTAHPITSLWLLLSPAWGPWMVKGQLIKTNPNDFWLNCAITLVWSCLFFALAAAVLRHSWKGELSATVSRSRGVSSWFQSGTDWRRKHARWLEINPCAWQAMSDRQPVRVGWAVMVIVVVFSALCYGLMPRGWIKSWMLVALAIIVNGALEWLLAHTAAKRLSDARRSSALELILTTPVEVREILDGHMLALDCQFRPLFRGAFFLELCVMLAGLHLHTWNWRSSCDYLIVWCFLLLWTGRRGWPRTYKNSVQPMWVGFNTGRPGLTVSKAVGQHRFMFFNLFYLFMGSNGIQHFPSGSGFEFSFLVIMTAFIGLVLLLRPVFRKLELTRESKNRIETMLERDFRLIAAEPLPDPKDPRLKKWKPNEPLYRHRSSLLPPVT